MALFFSYPKSRTASGERVFFPVSEVTGASLSWVKKPESSVPSLCFNVRHDEQDLTYFDQEAERVARALVGDDEVEAFKNSRSVIDRVAEEIGPAGLSAEHLP